MFLKNVLKMYCELLKSFLLINIIEEIYILKYYILIYALNGPL